MHIYGCVSVFWVTVVYSWVEVMCCATANAICTSHLSTQFLWGKWPCFFCVCKVLVHCKEGSCSCSSKDNTVTDGSATWPVGHCLCFSSKIHPVMIGGDSQTYKVQIHGLRDVFLFGIQSITQSWRQIQQKEKSKSMSYCIPNITIIQFCNYTNLTIICIA